jgi:hypothetical protein
MSIRVELEVACDRLGITSADFAEVTESEALPLTTEFLHRFTGGKDGRWWWEHFTMPRTSVHFSDGLGFKRISRLVPNVDERVWFVAEDDQLPYFPVYESTPSIIQSLIGECYGFEYYLIAKDFSWLLCETHHNTVVGLGTVRSGLSECRDEPLDL